MQNRSIHQMIVGCLGFVLLLAGTELRSPASEKENSNVAGDGKQAGQNLAKNGDFENGLEGWTTPQGGQGKAEVVRGPQSNCVCLNSTNCDVSTYVTQSLDPQFLQGRLVHLELKMKAENVVPGKFPYSHAKIILIENNGKNDTYHEKDFDGSFDWKTVRMSWKISKDCRQATLVLGLHTTTGTVWYDDVRVGVPVLQSERTLAEGVQERVYDDGVTLCVDGQEYTELKSDQAWSDFQPTEAEQEKGFVFYRTEEPGDVAPGRLPYRKEVLKSETPITLLAAADQSEPIAFAVWALRPLKRVGVKVLELTGPENARIPSTAFDVHLGRQVIQRLDYQASEYHVVPKLLEPKSETDIMPGRPQLVWVTLHVPADASPGEYSGKIVIEADNQVAMVPVQLRVLPFRLVPNKPWMLFYYNSSPADAESYFRDMRDYGMTSVILAQVNAPLRRDGERVVVDFATTDAFVEAYRKAGLEGTLVYNPFHDRLATRLLELFGQADQFPKVVNYGEQICVFKEDEFPAQLQEVYRDVLRSIDAHAKQANWPPLLYYAVDEPNDLNDWRAVAAKMEYRLIKEAIPTARTFCTAYTLEAMKNVEPWVDVRAVPISGLLHDAQTAKSFQDYLRGAGGEIWGIEWPAMWDGFWRSRQLGGFQPAKAGLTAMTAWTYYTPAPWTDEYSDLRGQCKGCHIVYRGVDGTLIPTLAWEGLRAGVTDWRYVATLEDAIAKAEGAKRRRGEETLQAILAGIPWNTEKQDEWKNSRANELRAQIGEAIRELQQ